MKLYLKFFSMHLKSRMAYKKSFFFSVIGQFLTSFTAFLAIWFLFERFNEVKGYTISECMLCAGVIAIAFGVFTFGQRIAADIAVMILRIGIFTFAGGNTADIAGVILGVFVGVFA